MGAKLISQVKVLRTHQHAVPLAKYEKIRILLNDAVNSFSQHMHRNSILGQSAIPVIPNKDIDKGFKNIKMLLKETSPFTMAVVPDKIESQLLSMGRKLLYKFNSHIHQGLQVLDTPGIMTNTPRKCYLIQKGEIDDLKYKDLETMIWRFRMFYLPRHDHS